MSKHSIPYAVFNSCNSAKVQASYTSNLARTVVSCSVHAVVAMTYKFTASATQVFSLAFYSRLFNCPGPPDIMSACISVRLALAANPVRKGRFNLDMYLPDYIIPVLYLRQEAANDFRPWPTLYEPALRFLCSMDMLQLNNSYISDLLSRNLDLLRSASKGFER